jgi:hypothetical protein
LQGFFIVYYFFIFKLNNLEMKFYKYLIIGFLFLMASCKEEEITTIDKSEKLIEILKAKRWFVQDYSLKFSCNERDDIAFLPIVYAYCIRKENDPCTNVDCGRVIGWKKFLVTFKDQVIETSLTYEQKINGFNNCEGESEVRDINYKSNSAWTISNDNKILTASFGQVKIFEAPDDFFLMDYTIISWTQLGIELEAVVERNGCQVTSRVVLY